MSHRPLEKRTLSESIPSARLELRKHRDDPQLARMMFEHVDRDRTRLGQFLPWVPFVKTVDDEIKYIRDCNTKWAECSLFDYGIFLKPQGQYVGNIGVHSIKWEHRGAEIGYWILGQYEGHGLMTEATLALERELFLIGFQRVQICCSAANQRSAAVPRRAGYIYEGTHRHDAIENGAFRNTMVFAKLLPDWLRTSASGT